MTDKPREIPILGKEWMLAQYFLEKESPKVIWDMCKERNKDICIIRNHFSQQNTYNYFSNMQCCFTSISSYAWMDGGQEGSSSWYFQHEGFCLTITFTMLVKYILLVYIKWSYKLSQLCESHTWYGTVNNYRNCYLHNLIQYKYTWPVLGHTRLCVYTVQYQFRDW